MQTKNKYVFYDGQQILIPNKKSIGKPIGESKIIKNAVGRGNNFLYLYIDDKHTGKPKYFLSNLCNIDFQITRSMNTFKEIVEEEIADEFSKEDLTPLSVIENPLPYVLNEGTEPRISTSSTGHSNGYTISSDWFDRTVETLRASTSTQINQNENTNR